MKNLRNPKLWNVCVFPYISLTMGITFPTVWDIYGFLLNLKHLRNPQIWNFCVFPCFSRTMEIHFFYVLGTAWISAWYEKFKKPLTLKCLCFSILFPYYGNLLFPCFENCMDFCVTKNIWETHNFGMFFFFFFLVKFPFLSITTKYIE